MSKKAILYARVSGDDRKNVTSSIDGQLAECRRYCEKRGYTIVGEAFEEPDKQTSGADWLPELDRVVRLAPNGSFDVLVVREIDRLARNRFKQLSIEIELENHGVIVEYVIGQFENSDEGRLLKGIMSEFAEFERTKIRRRTQNGILRSVEAGNVTIGGSVAPYGYDPVIIDGKRILCINEQEAAVVRLIFELYANQRYSLHAVRDYLDYRKIPKPCKGTNHRKMNRLASWSLGTLNGIIDNETYTGRWYYGKTKTIKDVKTGKTRHVPRAREEWVEIRVPAIIPDELFQAVQHRREANKRQMGHQRKHQYTLGGMIRCGRCGNGMAGITRVLKAGSYPTYICNCRREPKKFGFTCDNPPFKTKHVDAAVWGWISALLVSPEALRLALDESQQKQRDRIHPLLSMIESNQARLGELEGRKERLIAAYTKGVLALEELATQKVALDKEIDTLTQAIAALRAEIEPQILTAEQIETIETVAAKLRESVDFATDDPTEQRALYQILDVQVTLNSDENQRWADVECALGSKRCAVEYNTSLGIVSRIAALASSVIPTKLKE